MKRQILFVNKADVIACSDIDDCLVSLINQGQFTPLPEALCWVILELTSSGQHAVLESIRNCLHLSFPDIEKPSSQVVYDTLAKLMSDKKIYQTSQGYFIVTPETRRLRPQKQSDLSPHMKRTHRRSYSDVREESRTKGLLMSNEEALAYVHGEMTTIRDGDVTHQSIQTNLADVICGGNPNDKILYATIPKRNTPFPLERRNSLKLFGSNKRLNGSLTRSGSMKYIPHKSATMLTDSSSSTEYTSQDYQPLSTKKTSFLTRLFRRSSRKRGLSAPPTIHTFSAQFPPAEWFNPKVIHMHCVGTQTKPQDLNSEDQLLNWEMETNARYVTPRVGSKSLGREGQTQKDGHIYQKPKHQNEKSSGNGDSLKRKQEMERMRLLKSDHLSADILPTSDRSFYRQLYGQERSSRRSSFSKSSKSLNRNYEYGNKTESRIYEEIKNKSSDSFPKLESSSGNLNDGIYTKINAKKTRSNEGFISEEKAGKKEIISNPTTPKYKRKVEKRSSSLPRRKISLTSIQKSDGVTHTDFPYDEKLLKSEDPITPNLTNRRSSSYENVNFEEDFMKKLDINCSGKGRHQGDNETKEDGEKEKKNERGDADGKYKTLNPLYLHLEDVCSHDMTSLTSSGYDTQTNSIVSTSDQIPYSLKLNKNYLNSTTPPPSLTITEDFEQHKNKAPSESSSRSISPYSPPAGKSTGYSSMRSQDHKPLLNVSSNISVTTTGNKNSLSVQVMTNPRSEAPKVYVSSNTEAGNKSVKTTRITDKAEIFVQSPVNSVVTLQNYKNEKNSNLERFPSLYSPREVLKTGYGFESYDFRSVNGDDDSDLDDRRKFSDLDIGSISKNQENCSIDNFVIDSEKDDFGLSHKPIPRHFALGGDPEKSLKLSGMTDGKLTKSGSKIPVMKNRKNLDRPSSIEGSQSLLGNRKSDLVKKDFHEFPSLSDLSVNFKSIAAQNILNNISLTSVDTLVEVNMAANNLNDKSNPLVNVHTDFGII
ncbi:hypothetical protein RUM43_011402 [Polyplax serrata]|uniref:Winged helix Storkhead-box1 domain-containing protein n=1 Tax=Polyplax serrata TaxID=468196 RepID=A0AAN8P7A0_POLSC